MSCQTGLSNLMRNRPKSGSDDSQSLMLHDVFPDKYLGGGKCVSGHDDPAKEKSEPKNNTKTKPIIEKKKSSSMPPLSKDIKAKTTRTTSSSGEKDIHKARILVENDPSKIGSTTKPIMESRDTSKTATKSTNGTVKRDTMPRKVSRTVTSDSLSPIATKTSNSSNNKDKKNSNDVPRGEDGRRKSGNKDSKEETISANKAIARRSSFRGNPNTTDNDEKHYHKSTSRDHESRGTSGGRAPRSTSSTGFVNKGEVDKITSRTMSKSLHNQSSTKKIEPTARSRSSNAYKGSSEHRDTKLEHDKNKSEAHSRASNNSRQHYQSDQHRDHKRSQRSGSNRRGGRDEASRDTHSGGSNHRPRSNSNRRRNRDEQGPYSQPSAQGIHPLNQRSSSSRRGGRDEPGGIHDSSTTENSHRQGSRQGGTYDSTAIHQSASSDSAHCRVRSSSRRGDRDEKSDTHHPISTQERERGKHIEIQKQVSSKKEKEDTRRGLHMVEAEKEKESSKRGIRLEEKDKENEKSKRGTSRITEREKSKSGNSNHRSRLLDVSNSNAETDKRYKKQSSKERSIRGDPVERTKPAKYATSKECSKEGPGSNELTKQNSWSLRDFKTEISEKGAQIVDDETNHSHYRLVNKEGSKHNRKVSRDDSNNKACHNKHSQKIPSSSKGNCEDMELNNIEFNGIDDNDATSDAEDSIDIEDTRLADDYGNDPSGAYLGEKRHGKKNLTKGRQVSKSYLTGINDDDSDEDECEFPLPNMKITIEKDSESYGDAHCYVDKSNVKDHNKADNYNKTKNSNNEDFDDEEDDSFEMDVQKFLVSLSHVSAMLDQSFADNAEEDVEQEEEELEDEEEFHDGAYQDKEEEYADDDIYDEDEDVYNISTGLRVPPAVRARHGSRLDCDEESVCVPVIRDFNPLDIRAVDEETFLAPLGLDVEARPAAFPIFDTRELELELDADPYVQDDGYYSDGDDQQWLDEQEYIRNKKSKQKKNVIQVELPVEASAIALGVHVDSDSDGDESLINSSRGQQKQGFDFGTVSNAKENVNDDSSTARKKSSGILGIGKFFGGKKNNKNQSDDEDCTASVGGGSVAGRILGKLKTGRQGLRTNSGSTLFNDSNSSL